ncbi:ABC transporter permease [Mesorhizobium sp. M0208]|uniref:ABC transporter permease n=1 Tax=Mesorhizobium sp. M0208 TaxID=2956916 RepID=UPI003334B4F9
MAGMRHGQEIVVALATVAIFAAASLVNPRFLLESNLNTIFSGNAYVAVAAIGMSLVIISGNIDVSVGAVIGVLATIAGTLAVRGYPVWICWTAPIVAGMLTTTCMGALVAYARIPSIVVTLGMLSILRGALITVTDGVWITDLPQEFLLARMQFLGLPAPVVLMVGLTILTALIMRHSALGRAIYAVGGNAEAARSAGIRVPRTLLAVFALHGFFAGVAALLFATQLQVIQSSVPSGLEQTIITASVIGGVSILGGSGTVIGSTLAAMLFAAIGSSLIFVNVSAYWLKAIVGLLILATVLADIARRGSLE